MQKYRHIYYPKCPYCGVKIEERLGNYNYSKLVGMATGSGSDDVVLTCDGCNKKYRVTCTTKFNTRRINDADSN